MIAVRAIAVGLLLVGAVANAAGLVLVGVLLLLGEVVSTIWSRRGLRRVTYTRTLASTRASFGDDVGLDIAIHNAKLLPLAWLQAEDLVSDTVSVRERHIQPSEQPGRGILANTWTLAPYERVIRHFHVQADRRGIIRFGPVRLEVADVFGRGTNEVVVDLPGTLLVRPRTVPVRTAGLPLLPLGGGRSRSLLVEDPERFAGVRPFQLGDPRRRVHPRASVRVGRPVSKRYDPSSTRQIAIVLDLQTIEGATWLMAYDEDLAEGLAVAAASLARRLIDDGGSVGLVANGWTDAPSWTAFVAPATGAVQLARILDTLGRLSTAPSRGFDGIVGTLPGRLPTGTSVIVLAARDLGTSIGALRRLRTSGFDVRHIAIGPDAALHARRTRVAGIDSAVAEMTPDWRTCGALDVA